MAEPGAGGGAVRPKTPIHLWIVGVLSLLWNSGGAFNYWATHARFEFYISTLTPEQLDFFSSFPSWAVAAWAFGVWGALGGSIGLLLRQRWAVWAFGLSLLGMIVNSIYTLGLSNGLELMGTGQVIFSVVIWLVAIALLVYAQRMAARGVLR